MTETVLANTMSNWPAWSAVMEAAPLLVSVISSLIPLSAKKFFLSPSRIAAVSAFGSSPAYSTCVPDDPDPFAAVAVSAPPLDPQPAIARLMARAKALAAARFLTCTPIRVSKAVVDPREAWARCGASRCLR
jgi:hypothetical protein